MDLFSDPLQERKKVIKPALFSVLLYEKIDDMHIIQKYLKQCTLFLNCINFVFRFDLSIIWDFP